jgi:hypothetical protein
MAKKTSKPKSTKKKSKPSQAIPMPSRRTVDIKKATNGFVVSSYGNHGETLFIAKTAGDANKFVHKLLKTK